MTGWEQAGFTEAQKTWLERYILGEIDRRLGAVKPAGPREVTEALLYQMQNKE